MADLPFQCSCGALTGVVSDVTPAAGTHAECFCKSCRAGEVYCGAPDPAPDPVGIFQTSPFRVRFTSGQENLAVFSFGEKNLLRWRAACCGSALFNTPRNPKVSFVGIRTNCLADPKAIGPVTGQGFIPAENGKTRHKGLPKLIWSGVKRIAANRVSGRWKQTPFFDLISGAPIAPVKVVTREERKALFQS